MHIGIPGHIYGLMAEDFCDGMDIHTVPPQPCAIGMPELVRRQRRDGWISPVEAFHFSLQPCAPFLWIQGGPMLMYQVWAGAIHFQAAFICLYRHIRQWICESCHSSVLVQRSPLLSAAEAGGICHRPVAVGRSHRNASQPFRRAVLQSQAVIQLRASYSKTTVLPSVSPHRSRRVCVLHASCFSVS